ncbi:MAG: DNA polymerase IV [Proteobacteria bacterium]|nr:DNA polymerase IV [Pseudomonadota bacterium]
MILHVDMDAFFASVEQATNPSLRGLPIAVAGAQKRTVITTASYEARKYGVKTGMAIEQGLKLCPNLKIVVANFKKYEATSIEIMEILKCYGVVEVYSVDEAFVDIGSQDPFKITEYFKKDIRKRFNITCSVGAGENKLLAKLASGLRKPDGFFWIKSISDIYELPVGEICGIGKRTARKLALSGITSIKDFVSAPFYKIKSIMGINGIRTLCFLRGDLKDYVKPYEDKPKSIGNSMTFDRDLFHSQEIYKALFQLAEKVGYRLRRESFEARHLSLIIRYKDFYTFSLEHKQNMAFCEEQEIFTIAKDLIDSIEIEKPIRLLGISVSRLVPSIQQRLFSNRREGCYRAIDKIREKWGFDIITWGIVKDKYLHNKPISPAWRPEKVC